MNIPPFLTPGDTIAIVSTARKITMDEIEVAVKVISDWGLNVKVGKTVGLENNQYAGYDEDRAIDFQNFLDDTNVKAILCARGGYGTVRMVDSLDFLKFVEDPKWIIGYSDITVLHGHIHANYGIPTLHATMPISFKDFNEDSSTIQSLKRGMFGESLDIDFSSNELNIAGECKGELIGGNLSVLYSLLGSPSDVDSNGKILFLEDLDEYLYHIDRMMINLKRSGKLKNLAGLLLGGMTDMNDNEVPLGKSAEEIVLEHVKEYGFPVAFGFPAGHPPSENVAMIFGKEVKLSISDKCSLQYC
ncbi:MAG: LD-carboxypeptidase [Bacteroidetes bacterium]|nr:LD-carboxypeptidase [Bacteroidia bacterium]PCH69140.1 MAG: LD-carboxypeptidase [Bacteroidota bacterium]